MLRSAPAFFIVASSPPSSPRAYREFIVGNRKYQSIVGVDRWLDCRHHKSIEVSNSNILFTSLAWLKSTSIMYFGIKLQSQSGELLHDIPGTPISIAEFDRQVKPRCCRPFGRLSYQLKFPTCKKTCLTPPMSQFFGSFAVYE